MKVSAHLEQQTPILEVSDLSLRFDSQDGPLYALDGISFALHKGEMLSLVGESGCGKSVTAMAIMGLLPKRGATVTSGVVRLGSTDLLTQSEKQLRSLRGNRIGMVFQDPMSSLNPVHTIGMQIAEVWRNHKKSDWRTAYRKALEMLELVRIPDAANRLRAYPHELSGGMRQRVMIAMALVCKPELLIADEPTTALDVTVQAQVLDLLEELKTELGMSVLLITHDLGVVAGVSDRMMVMYAGRIVEEGPVAQIFARPSHGYTAGLLQSLPTQGVSHRAPLTEINGTVPRLTELRPGCTFAARCAFASPACNDPLPNAQLVSADHKVRCINSQTVFEAVARNDVVRAWS